jgi:hypothetical protein
VCSMPRSRMLSLKKGATWWQVDNLRMTSGYDIYQFQIMINCTVRFPFSLSKQCDHDCLARAILASKCNFPNYKHWHQRFSQVPLNLIWPNIYYLTIPTCNFPQIYLSFRSWLIALSLSSHVSHSLKKVITIACKAWSIFLTYILVYNVPCLHLN